jgi:hypothetical protein
LRAVTDLRPVGAGDQRVWMVASCFVQVLVGYGPALSST